VEARLNDRQKEMIQLLLQGEALTSRFCSERFHVTRDTTVRDFKVLLELGLVKKEGRGRAIQYLWIGRP